MKTPEEIKKGLEKCANDRSVCNECEFSNNNAGKWQKLMGYALAYIQQLEADNSRLTDTIRSLTEQLNAAHEETAKAMRERDAAVRELPHHCWNCTYYLDKPIEETDDYGRTIHIYCSADCCFPEEENSSWQWRGVCPENTEVQDED